MKTRRRLTCVLLALALAGCGDGDVKEVNLWMQQVRQQSRVLVPPLSAPKTFIPFAYTAKDVTDPFSPNKLQTELAKAARSGSAFKPDLDRRKEVLESFPLDTLRMVGTLQQGGATYALLQVEKAVYRVRAGEHLGQNFGAIVGITEAAVTIREIVQDAAGDWVERMSKLELQDSKESGK